MACPICDNEYEKNLLYQNDKMIIMLAPTPAAAGHIQIFSKVHVPIIEQVDDEALGMMAVTANKMSMILFETLKIHGTNLLIQNGNPAGQKIAHASISIIPRKTDDGMKLDWALKQATPESLDSVHRMISEGMAAKQQDAKPLEIKEEKRELISAKPSQIIDVTSTTKNNDSDSDDSEKKINYYLKSLERIP